MQCANCRKPLSLGVDVISVQHGVIGPRGVVPLDEPRLYCCESCAGADLDEDPEMKRPRRIP